MSWESIKAKLSPEEVAEVLAMLQAADQMGSKRLTMAKRLVSILKQPSTYAGLSGLALIFGWKQAEFEQAALAIAGVFGVLAVFLSESPNA